MDILDFLEAKHARQCKLRFSYIVGQQQVFGELRASNWYVIPGATARDDMLHFYLGVGGLDYLVAPAHAPVADSTCTITMGAFRIVVDVDNPEGTEGDNVGDVP